MTTFKLNGKTYDLKLTNKQGDILARLNSYEYFNSMYTATRERVYNDIKRDIKNANVDYKGITMKDIERVIQIVNKEISRKKEEAK